MESIDSHIGFVDVALHSLHAMEFSGERERLSAMLPYLEPGIVLHGTEDDKRRLGELRARLHVLKDDIEEQEATAFQPS